MPIDEKDMQQITRRLDERYVKREDCDNTQKETKKYPPLSTGIFL